MGGKKAAKKAKSALGSKSGKGAPKRDKRGRLLPGQTANPSGLSRDKRELIEDVRDKLLGKDNSNLDAACNRLVELVQSDDERVAAAAIKEYFDRVLGKAPQAITGMGGGPIRLDFTRLTDEELRRAYALMSKAGLDGSVVSTT